LNLENLRRLLSDPELRDQVSRLLTRKIRADTRTVEVNTQLAQYIGELARRPDAGDAAMRALRATIKEHLDYYETLVGLTLAFNDRLMERLNGAAESAQATGTQANMVLSAQPGAVVRAPFHLENNKKTPIDVGFEMTPFASADGNQLIASQTAFDPPTLQIQPGQERKIDLIFTVGDAFRVNEDYFSTVTVTGLEGTQLLIKLRVERSPGAVIPPIPETESLVPVPASVATAPEPAKTVRTPRKVKTRAATGRSAHKPAMSVRRKP
jgi:hypothetical protein